MLFSNDWYSTLAKPNVDVVTEPVVEVLPEGVRSGDGTVHEVDVIIYGTGFAATEFLAPMQITGADGADLHARWKGGARAFLGMCVPDFPNLFVVYGPNTNLGGSSIINMLEAAAGAITTLLRHADTQGARAVAVRPEAEERYDTEMQDRLKNSVWASCHNWYHQDGGRISTNWPGLVAEYQQRCAETRPRRLRHPLEREHVGQPDQLQHVLRRRAGRCVEDQVLPPVGRVATRHVQRLHGRARQPGHAFEVEHDAIVLRDVVESITQVVQPGAIERPGEVQASCVGGEGERPVQVGPLRAAMLAGTRQHPRGPRETVPNRGDGAVLVARHDEAVDHPAHHPQAASASLTGVRRHPGSTVGEADLHHAGREQRAIDGQPSGGPGGVRVLHHVGDQLFGGVLHHDVVELAHPHRLQPRASASRTRGMAPTSATRSRCRGAGCRVSSATRSAMSSAYPLRWVIVSSACWHTRSAGPGDRRSCGPVATSAATWPSSTVLPAGLRPGRSRMPSV